ncbi:MAG: dihydropteroate synthase [Deltaproteobacteria bacterium]|nr:dihydropteroate synthase [Deltaproteobacteria bacterium]
MNHHLSPTLSQLAGLEVGDEVPVRIMGVLNVSPESFYQGSVHDDPAQLIKAACAMVDAGAHIIDIGAMSTAPYLKTLISEDEETVRLSSAVRVVAAQVHVPVSADTKRANVARSALDCGARIINDVSGLKHDPAMAPLIASYRAGAILMASEPVPRPGLPLQRTLRALQESVEVATQAGLPRTQIVLDPGIGFFRQPGIPWDEWDCLMLRELGQLRQLGLPLLVGASRKSFIGKILDQANPTDRLIGSVTCAAIAVYNGAHIIRAHDVKETVEAVRMAERLRPVFPLSAATR